MRRLIFAIALTLVVSAQFTAGAAATSPGGWNHLGTGIPSANPSLNGTVFALNADDPGVLLVGGAFTDAGGNPNADRIAKWNGSTWTPIGATPLDNGQVRAIAYSSGRIFVGGTFVNAGGVPNLNNLAMWNGVTWSPACSGAIGGTVSALQIIGNTLYVGGAFQNGAGINAADYLVACDLTTTAASATVASDGGINGSVNALAVDTNGVLYAGGQFINMATIPGADHIAAYDGAWHSMGSQHAVNDIVYSVATYGTDVYVGTTATDIAGITQADHIARWDGSLWHAVGADTAGTGGWFNSFAFPYGMIAMGPYLFVTGSFQNANGVATADDIAWFDGTAWHPIGSNGAGNGPLTQNGLALAIFLGSLYVGGTFTAGSDPKAANAASYPFDRSDALIGTALHGPFIGDGVYSTTAAGESKKISVARGHTGTFYVDIQNDGLLANALTVSGSAGVHGFSVTYFRGATNVTASVRAGTYSTGNLAPDQHQTLKVVVKVAAGSANSGTFLIKAKLAGSSTDVVKAIVKAI